MTWRQFANIDFDEHEAKSMAIYREKFAPWSTRRRRAGCWSSTRKAATTRLTTGQRLPQNA